ncbi:MAG: hypothetical protein ABI091_15275 [Ferruginibacter sp.]
MENNQNEMTHSESLALIASMINKAKNRFSENGLLYLWWGWLIFACCTIQFIVFYFYNENAWYIWISTWVMAVFQIYIIRKKKKEKQVKTYTEEINGFIWLVFFICLMLSIFIIIYSGNFKLIYPILLVLYGLPIFLSGVILKFKPLILGSIYCWVLSILSLFISAEFQLLLVAVAVLLAWVIPGYLLRSKYNNNLD